MKRTNYIDWETYFMGIASLAALRSKDPNTQVGACIVSNDNIIIGIGYNGLPQGCSDDAVSWKRTDEDPLNTKYPYVCHAELNAILNCNSAKLNECKLYVTLMPCNECAKAIIQSGIREVIYQDNKYPDSIATKAALFMFDKADIELRKYSGKYKIKSEML